MSRPRSRSPRYRRFPWDEPDFDPHKVVAELNGSPDRRDHPREDPEEHWDHFREDMHPKAQRRSPPSPDDRQFGHQRYPNQEEFNRRWPSPHHDVMGFEDDRRLSPLHDGGDGRRGGFRQPHQSFENSERSPPRFTRERLPPAPRSHPDHQQREPEMGWRREEHGRGQGRVRDLSPFVRSDEQRGGAGRERGRKNLQGPNRDRRREDSYQERNPPLKRQRREMDDAAHLGYRNERDFGEQRYSVDIPRDRFGGDRQGSLPRGDVRHPRPLVIDHDHGIPESGEPSWMPQFDKRGELDPDFDQRRSPPPPMGSSEERFRTSDLRLDDREDARGSHFQDDWRDTSYHETRRNPASQDRPNSARYGNRDGPVSHRGRGGPHPARGKFSRGQGGRTGPPRNQPRSQQPPQGYQDLPREEKRPVYRPVRKDCYKDPVDGEPAWPEEDRLQEWEPPRPRSLDRQRSDFGPKGPRQRERGWSEHKADNMTVITEETLKIKVDMSRPVNKTSSLCYSSDRQLSLDLVNVGRQRLDFLPMLEHSGTYRESPMHTGTFAQEIITLVHQVKEQYFCDDGLSLNERFSAPQKGGYCEDETEELTLDERFSSNRGFSLNMSSLLEDDESLFSRQPVRGPGDLRHDLERRRQERLEGVTVTIAGNRMQQHLLEAVSDAALEFSDQEELPHMEDEGFSSWPEEQSRRREGNMGPRRGGGSFSSQRRNTRPVQRLGPTRRPNYHSNPAGPNW